GSGRARGRGTRSCGRGGFFMRVAPPLLGTGGSAEGEVQPSARNAPLASEIARPTDGWAIAMPGAERTQGLAWSRCAGRFPPYFCTVYFGRGGFFGGWLFISSKQYRKPRPSCGSCPHAS